ncbi:MAG: antiviral reverse transcriptase Drt2, partial [Candidatus Entotheonellia bacterium]
MHFAVAAFEEIKSRRDCDVIALDVEDFFGSLDHAVLKVAWISLLEPGCTLPDDHYAAYKAITRYSWIDRATVRGLLRRDIPRRRTSPGDRICTPEEFRTHLRPKIEKNCTAKGIPQGSPISAV